MGELFWIKKQKQAEAEVVPSSSLVEVEDEVGVVEVEVGVEDGVVVGFEVESYC